MVALQVPQLFWLQPSFDLPFSVLTFPGNISLFLLGSISFTLPFCFWVKSRVYRLASWPPAMPACSPALQMIFLHFEQFATEVWPALMSSLTFMGSLTWDQSCLSDEVLCPCLAHCLQDRKLQHLTAPAVKAAIDWQFILIQDPNKAPPLVSLFSTCIKKLSSMHSRNLYCLCPITLSPL